MITFETRRLSVLVNITLFIPESYMYSEPGTGKKHWLGNFFFSHLELKYQRDTKIQDVLTLESNYIEFPIFADAVSSILSHKTNSTNTFFSYLEKNGQDTTCRV